MQNDEKSKPEKIPKKRGRKKKSDTVLPVEDKNNIVMIIEDVPSLTPNTNTEPIVPVEVQINNTGVKKRGRKPKGGKLITKKDETVEKPNQIANVILHLKCSMQDLTEYNNKMNKIFTNPLSYDPSIPPNIMTYDINKTQSFSLYENVNNFANEARPQQQLQSSNDTTSTIDTVNNKSLAYNDYSPILNSVENKCIVCSLCNEKMGDNTLEEDNDGDLNIKDINSKLKNLKLSMYKNMNQDKKSACFWCTYDYDNQPCYIPKYELDGSLYGYGSFCRPECAVAYLMKENIDDSMKFERYHLLNQIYSKVYNFKKNIKPAPNPYFLLEKFYGNLTIQEYRKLLKTEHMLLVLEKPMTLILPELHDDNDDFVMNIYGGKTQNVQNGSSIYKVKKQSEKQKGPTKTTIMKENFGF